MYLLDVRTGRLREFVGDEAPPYAILSHTWGRDEVSFQDLDDPKHKEKLGYAKIEGCCRQALRDGFDFVWVDTCCIDKRSSAELSEAINSMFRWYGKAAVCYIYLADVPPGDSPYRPDSHFVTSRWFTRGWTLQELIAPLELKFFDREWTMIFEVQKGYQYGRGGIRYGTLDECIHQSVRETWISTVSRITGIESWHEYSMYSLHTSLKELPVATRLSWMSERSTTRVEDMAYSLLGLLDVSMPLLYGEGRKAFIRLQEEFLKKHFDPSILLWGIDNDCLAIEELGGHLEPCGLAPTPLLFKWARDVRLGKTGFHSDKQSQEAWTLTPRGLRVELPTLRVDARSNAYICVTNYTVFDPVRSYELDRHDCNKTKCFIIPLQRLGGSDEYKLADHCRPVLLEMTTRWLKRSISKWKIIYLKMTIDTGHLLFLPFTRYSVDLNPLLQRGFRVDSIYPPDDPPGATVGIHHIFGRHVIIVLHRGQIDTLYLVVRIPDVRIPICKRGYKVLVCCSEYHNRRSAIEVWDSCYGRWRKRFCDPPQLIWQETTKLDVGDGEKYQVEMVYRNDYLVVSCRRLR